MRLGSSSFSIPSSNFLRFRPFFPFVMQLAERKIDGKGRNSDRSLTVHVIFSHISSLLFCSSSISELCNSFCTSDECMYIHFVLLIDPSLDRRCDETSNTKEGRESKWEKVQSHRRWRERDPNFDQYLEAGMRGFWGWWWPNKIQWLEKRTLFPPTNFTSITSHCIDTHWTRLLS